MLASIEKRILDQLADSDVVLDVGGWAKPLPRADWVIDLMPYGTRGLYGQPSTEAERFTSETWICRDICDREPWPFRDDQFDFAICSHTLEDLRDPVWVCQELSRVARAGYVEVPSRLEEQSWGVHGPWVGWSHHHWLMDLHDGGIEVVFKSHAIHGNSRFYFPKGFAASLTAAEKVQFVFWEDQVRCSERVFLTAEGIDSYLEDFVAANAGKLLDGDASTSFGKRIRNRLRHST